MNRVTVIALTMAAALVAGPCDLAAQAPALAPAAVAVSQTPQPAPKAAEPPPGATTPVQGSVAIGALINDNAGDLTHVARYDVARQGALPQVGLQFWGSQNGVVYGLSGRNGGSALDQTYRARVNVRRVLNVQVDYS